MARSFAVLHCQKIKTLGDVAGLGKHNERARETPNADPARTLANERLAGTGDWLADVQARLDVAPTIRKNAVLAISTLLSASREWFEAASTAQIEAWRDRSMAWLRETYGERNVVAAILHRDETTLHIQALVVPIDERGRLNAAHWLDGRDKLASLQDSYARAVEDLGLVRGVRGSRATHQEVRDYYAKITAPTPTPEIVTRALDVERPGRIVPNPDRWASEQRERIAGQIAPTLDAALAKAAHLEGQAAKAEANVLVLQRHVRALEQENTMLKQDYKALVAQVRGIGLEDTMRTLGGQRDRYDTHKWRVAGEHISINGEKFYNHDQARGGGGSIDLVMHVTGYTFRQAVAYLHHEGGGDLAIAAASQHGARQGQEIVARGERAPFNPPPSDEGRWLGVRAYLVEQRALPAQIVDELHRQGTVYADHRANAIFLRRDAKWHAVGASLRGTLPGSEFQGLAPGTQREAGHFSYTVGELRPYEVPQYVITESPIDAMSAHALTHDGGLTTFVSTDGSGDLPRRQIDEGLAQGALVRCAFDNDRAGENLWAKVREVYPDAPTIVRDWPPAGAKDWNDALRTERGIHQQERMRALERGCEMDTRANERR